MKIKTTKKMRLDELLKNVWDGNLPAKTYASDRFKEKVNVKQNGVDFSELTFAGMHKITTYTVEIEEELTEDTEIQGATLVYYDKPSREVKPFRYADVTSPTLKHIIQPRHDTVALAVFRGKQLIWTKEHGIPESGVLEVSE